MKTQQSQDGESKTVTMTMTSGESRSRMMHLKPPPREAVRNQSNGVRLAEGIQSSMTAAAKFARANRNTYRLLPAHTGRKMNALRERRYRYWRGVEARSSKT